MGGVKISLITVSCNAAGTIERCIRSVINQDYPVLEYIVIDGQSTDGTMAIINKYQDKTSIIVSEPDGGIYQAMNKGIALATGDVIGMLNADDYFAANNILSQVAGAFTTSGADVIYGDIDYVDEKGKTVRKWRSGTYKHGYFNWGWMPPHPSFYARRQLFTKYGAYQSQYGSAADYELMLRFIHTNRASVCYVDKVLVHMQTGGVSNKSLINRIKAWENDFKAMRVNGLLFPHLSFMLKPFRKITQYTNTKL